MNNNSIQNNKNNKNKNKNKNKVTNTGNTNNTSNTSNTTTGVGVDKSNVDTNIVTEKTDIGMYEVVSENYVILLGVTSAIIIIIIIYFFSQTFRVDRTLQHMSTYIRYQQLSSIDYSKYGESRLGNNYIASAYNASHSGYQMYDYTSEHIVKAALQSGARYLEFNVFNSEFGKKAYPVASMGYKVGEWKMMAVDTPMETILETIANNAFKIFDGIEGVNNSDDPIFISLNLNTNSNLECLNLLAFLITKFFADRLLPNEYAFQNNDHIANLTLSKLIGKVVIFSSNGFQGSGLEEIVNYSWDNIDNNPNHNMRRLHYSDIIKPNFNKHELIKFNKTGLTIIIPHKEGDFLNTNYNPIPAVELGCQFIAMEYQYVDINMDHYITRFKHKSIILKDPNLNPKTNNN